MMFLVTTALLVHIALAATKYPASDPQNKLGWTPYWSLWDEFNSDTLNSDKWVIHSPELNDYFWYYGRAPGLVDSSNIKISKGRLYLYASKDKPIPSFYQDRGFDTFTVSMFHSKTKLKYGYSEIKAKIGTSRVSSSFWFWGKTDTDATEIDVFEQGGPINAIKENHYHKLHSNRYIHKLKNVDPDDLPAKCNCAYGNGDTCHDTPIGNTWSRSDIDSFSDDWHIYGMHWTASKIKIYVDGELAITMNNDCNKYPMWLFLNRATMPTWFGIPDEDDIPDQPFQIEYIRTWKQSGSSAFTEDAMTDGGEESVGTMYGVLIAGCSCICVCVLVFVYICCKKREKRLKRMTDEIKLENEEDVDTVGDTEDMDGYDMSPVVAPDTVMTDGRDGFVECEDEEIQVEVEIEYEQTGVR